VVIKTSTYAAAIGLKEDAKLFDRRGHRKEGRTEKLAGTRDSHFSKRIDGPTRGMR